MLNFSSTKSSVQCEPSVRHHSQGLPVAVSRATFLCMFRTGQIAMRFDVVNDDRAEHIIHIVPNGALFRDALLRFAQEGKTVVEVFRPDGTCHTYQYGGL